MQYLIAAKDNRRSRIKCCLAGNLSQFSSFFYMNTPETTYQDITAELQSDTRSKGFSLVSVVKARACVTLQKFSLCIPFNPINRCEASHGFAETSP